jgi:hypothetical protein
LQELTALSYVASTNKGGFVEVEQKASMIYDQQVNWADESSYQQ